MFQWPHFNICEVYIDDMLMFGTNNDTFLEITRTVFQRCLERNVKLNAKCWQFALTRHPSSITTLTQQVESTIAGWNSNLLKEFQFFLVVDNYFKDHLRDQSVINNMVASTTKQTTKRHTWTPASHIPFERLKSLVNNCRKLYFVDYNLPRL